MPAGLLLLFAGAPQLSVLFGGAKVSLQVNVLLVAFGVGILPSTTNSFPSAMGFELVRNGTVTLVVNDVLTPLTQPTAIVVNASE